MSALERADCSPGRVAVAEAHRYRFDDGTPYLDNFLVPFDLVNSHRPFTFELIG